MSAKLKDAKIEFFEQNFNCFSQCALPLATMTQFPSKEGYGRQQPLKIHNPARSGLLYAKSQKKASYQHLPIFRSPMCNGGKIFSKGTSIFIYTLDKFIHSKKATKI